MIAALRLAARSIRRANARLDPGHQLSTAPTIADLQLEVGAATTDATPSALRTARVLAFVPADPAGDLSGALLTPWEQIDRLREQHEINLAGAKAIARAHHFVWLKCHPHTGRWSVRPAAGWRPPVSTINANLNAASAAELGALMASIGLVRIPRPPRERVST